jgi:acyl-coA reductase (luxC)
VSDCLQHSRQVPFGRAQSPALTDYPDDRDVMAFLAGLA